ncbi:MAG: DUF111 family protein, partial [Candidatus Methanoperedens sp.]|nr:DUF111 family protein [Candidatus Methanoperedens sp.]
MKAILFDPFSGASGDMIIGALLDLGASPQKVREAMESAAHVGVEFSRDAKKGISAQFVNVVTKKEGSMTFGEILERINSLDLHPEIIKDAISVF